MNGLPTTAAMAQFHFQQQQGQPQQEQQQQQQQQQQRGRQPNASGSTSDNNAVGRIANTTITTSAGSKTDSSAGGAPGGVMHPGIANPAAAERHDFGMPPPRPGPSSSVSPPGTSASAVGDPAVGGGGAGGGTRSNSLMSETSSQPDVHPFFKESSGRYVVLYSYRAQDENDLGVDRGQCVTVLNSDDPDWYWVSR